MSPGPGWSISEPVPASGAATWFIFLYAGFRPLIFMISLFAETNNQSSTCRSRRPIWSAGYHDRIWRLQVVALLCGGVRQRMMVGAAVASPCSFSAAGIRCPGCPSPTWPGCMGLAPHPFLAGLLSFAIFFGKILILILHLSMWVRWTVPRFRYDQVMKIGWQRLLPLAIANLIVYAIAVAWIQDLSPFPSAMAVVTVARKPLSLAERSYLPQVAAGLRHDPAPFLPPEPGRCSYPEAKARHSAGLPRRAHPGQGSPRPGKVRLVSAM